MFLGTHYFVLRFLYSDVNENLEYFESNQNLS